MSHLLSRLTSLLSGRSRLRESNIEEWLGSTTGVVGQPWRAAVDPSGQLWGWEGGDLQWWVAATDRWHDPAKEPAVRQTRIDSTPVYETRLRVPNGDVVQRIYSVADAGGITIFEFENESTLPVAIALSRRDLLTDRPISDAPIEGIELPPEAFVMPLGHQATIRVGLSHEDPPRTGRLPAGLPSLAAVVRGWTSTIERTGRYVIPAGDQYHEVAARVQAQRGEIILGPLPLVSGDPAGFLLSLDVQVRAGEPASRWLDDVAIAVAGCGPDDSWRATMALDAAARILATTNEARAQADLRRILDQRVAQDRPEFPPSGDDPNVNDPALNDPALGPWLDQFFAVSGSLLPAGLPAAWRGEPVEIYNVPTGPRSTVSYALRWHGENVAILWEQSGDVLTLRAPALDPAWSSDSESGEALLVLSRANP